MIIRNFIMSYLLALYYTHSKERTFSLCEKYMLSVFLDNRNPINRMFNPPPSSSRHVLLSTGFRPAESAYFYSKARFGRERLNSSFSFLFHTARVFNQFLYPPRSPDLAPCDFFAITTQKSPFWKMPRKLRRVP